MYKNQLQELAQRSCFNLPSYACIREGPDHAPRFKASVNFNGEIFESSIYCTTLRQAEHSAAEVALNVLSTRGPSRSLTARVLDETGIYKNLLQETAHRAGLRLPVYTTIRSGPGHVPTFTCTVELAGMNFTGDSAKTKKQAEKNAAIAAWSALNKMPRLATNKVESNEEQKQASVTRVLSIYRPKDDANKHAVRRREQQNPPKRIFRSSHHHHHHNNNNNTNNNNNNNNNIIPASTSNSNMMSLHDDERWKLMDLVMELGQQDGSWQKHLNSFASLLPSPPPRTSSKILPPPSKTTTTTTTIKTTTVSSHCSAYSSINSPIPVQVRSRTSQIVAPPPLDQDHHQKNEEEWLGKNNHPIEREGLVYDSSSSFSTGKLANFGSSSSSSSGISVPRRMYSGECSPHPHRIAPAVHIRSVIPVCASPPPPPPPSTTTTSTEETPKSTSNASSCSPPPRTTASTSVSTQPGGGDVSTASSGFNKLQL